MRNKVVIYWAVLSPIPSAEYVIYNGSVCHVIWEFKTTSINIWEVELFHHHDLLLNVVSSYLRTWSMMLFLSSFIVVWALLVSSCCSLWFKLDEIATSRRFHGRSIAISSITPWILSSEPLRFISSYRRTLISISINYNPQTAPSFEKIIR
jgi:hypothetical protein